MSTLVIRRPSSPVRAAWTTRHSVVLPSSAVGSALAGSPVVALERDDEDGVLTVEAPGLDPAADLSVRLVGDRLTVAGTRRPATGPVRRESRFSRSVALPEGVGADAVTARYEAGVLRVRVAGMFPAPVQPEAVDIAITTDTAPRAGDVEQDGPSAGTAEQA